ncbi:MAG: hypothetical protein LBD08_05225 [Treponema sp.]|nr:hypothetical protein [Treponema sp.]
MLVIAPLLHAGGRGESPLARADSSIGSRNYDAAIRILLDTVEADPDRFAAAQKRLRTIITRRNEYHSLAEILLDVLETDPGNIDLILELSKQIEALEPSQRSEVRSFLAQVQELAQFSYNRKRVEAILEEGRRLIDAGEFQKAMAVYTGGLELYRDEFFNSGFDPVIISRTRNGLASAEGAAADFAALTGPAGPLERGIAALEQRSRNDTLPEPAQAAALYEPVMRQLEGLMVIHESLSVVGAYCQTLFDTMHETDADRVSRSFFSFVSRMIYGRSGQDKREGMIGTVEAYWAREVTRIEDVVFSMAARAYAGSLALTREEQYYAAAAGYETARYYNSLSLRSMDLWSQIRQTEADGGVMLFGALVPEGRAAAVLRRRAFEWAVSALTSTGVFGERYRALDHDPGAALDLWRRNELSAASAMAMEWERRESYRGLETELQAFTEEIRRRDAGFAEYRSLAGPRGIPYVADARTAAAALQSALIENIRGFTLGAYAIGTGDLEQRLEQAEGAIAGARQLIEGVEPPAAAEREDAEEAPAERRLSRYPLEGLSALEALDKRLAGDAAAGRELLARFTAEPGQIREHEAAAAQYRALEAVVENLEACQNRGLVLTEEARSLAAQAAALRGEGDRLYQEARAALGRNNFDAARERVLRAGERYDGSLALQESPGLRAERDAKLLNLDAEITRLEHELIVRDVRVLVNEARDTYFAGRFEQAEEILVRAQNRWRVTSVESNAEIGYWLTVVRGALSLRSGRNIPPTAPLYAEMSQLLSDAWRIYHEGVRFFNASRNQEGLERFTLARKKIQEVRVMFPLNQDAGLLELRVEQVMNPAAFNGSFQRRLAEAVAGTKRRSVEAFADLQNLAEINPRYPGLRAALTQAELDMGYRLPPPDTRAIARSDELTAQARAIIERNVRAQFPIALEQLNQALTLNPNNNQAMAEKDRVQTLMGGGGVVVLSSAAEQQYRRAIQELQQGNAVVALSIVQQLLQDPKNRNSTRLVELQRRIESVL